MLVKVIILRFDLAMCPWQSLGRDHATLARISGCGKYGHGLCLYALLL